tara:strand:- start:219 stop:416 length:198 start_codon:yes stop_codon:yes gene_type:complete
METVQSQPLKNNTDTPNYEKMFNENIYDALSDAMSIKTDNMSVEDFKNLVQFILNVKCQLIKKNV